MFVALKSRKALFMALSLILASSVTSPVYAVACMVTSDKDALECAQTCAGSAASGMWAYLLCF